jgi:thiamine biosynthesis lipoprotein
MGTRVTITVWGHSEKVVDPAAEAVIAEFQRIDRLMTSWLDDSDVSSINAAAGVRAVPVSAEVLRVIQTSLDISRKSRGAFDITVGAFRGLWKFDQDIDGTIPTEKEVRKRLPLVDYRNVLVNDKRGTVKLRRKGMRITLGGIAKGYAVDRAVSILRKRGMNDFILQAGGDLFASGRRGDRAWRVGIRDPRGARDAIFALAEIENATFSTSGDYERAVVKDGVRYHHILDPSTGYPVKKSRSVTVMAGDALTADVWSTALFVLGVQEGMKIVEQMKDVEAVFVDSNNEIHVSSGLKGKLWIQKQPTPGP